MRSVLFAIAGTVVLCLGVAGQSSKTQSKPSAVPSMVKSHSSTTTATDLISADAQTALVKQYCTTCHSDRGKAGGLTLASFDAAHAADNAAITEKMIRKLRAGMMPPAG